ncbi:MAG: hypothetical protein K2Q01_12440 [Rickettsiales bacterium]|nr:hypothetical protein [Rickettsiales bacterium]
MQLFELVRKQLKHVSGMVDKMKARQPTSALSNVNFPLLQTSLSKAKGESVNQDVASASIDLQTLADDRGMINVGMVQQGVNDFVHSVIQFAHNPVKNGKAAPDETSPYVGEGKDGEYRMCFPRLDVNAYQPQPLFQEADRIFALMFLDWKPQSPKSPILKKTFANRMDCERTAHLLVCLSNAAGMSQEEMEGAFYPAPNAHTLIVHENLMKFLAQVERADEADFGRKRHA